MNGEISKSQKFETFEYSTPSKSDDFENMRSTPDMEYKQSDVSPSIVVNTTTNDIIYFPMFEASLLVTVLAFAALVVNLYLLNVSFLD